MRYSSVQKGGTNGERETSFLTRDNVLISPRKKKLVKKYLASVRRRAYVIFFLTTSSNHDSGIPPLAFNETYKLLFSARETKKRPMKRLASQIYNVR